MSWILKTQRYHDLIEAYGEVIFVIEFNLSDQEVVVINDFNKFQKINIHTKTIKL